MVEVGLVRNHPKVHVGRRGVGMDVEPAARTVVFEGPGLGESVLFEDAGKFQPSLLGDVEEQGEANPSPRKAPMYPFSSSFFHIVDSRQNRRSASNAS